MTGEKDIYDWKKYKREKGFFLKSIKENPLFFIKTFVPGFLLTTVFVVIGSSILLFNNNSILSDNIFSSLSNLIAALWLGMTLGQYFNNKDGNFFWFDIGMLIGLFFWYLLFWISLLSNNIFQIFSNYYILLSSLIPIWTAIGFIIIYSLQSVNFFEEKEDIKKVLDVLKRYSKEGLTLEYLMINILIPFIKTPDLQLRNFTLLLTIIISILLIIFIINKYKSQKK